MFLLQIYDLEKQDSDFPDTDKDTDLTETKHEQFPTLCQGMLLRGAFI